MDQIEEVSQDYVQIKNENCIQIKLKDNIRITLTNQVSLVFWRQNSKKKHFYLKNSISRTKSPSKSGPNRFGLPTKCHKSCWAASTRKWAKFMAPSQSRRPYPPSTPMAPTSVCCCGLDLVLSSRIASRTPPSSPRAKILRLYLSPPPTTHPVNC